MNLSEKEKVSSSASSAVPTSRVNKELLNKKPNNGAGSVKGPSFSWLKSTAKDYASRYSLNSYSLSSYSLSSYSSNPDAVNGQSSLQQHEGLKACSSPRWFYKHEGDSDENNNFIKGYN